MIAPLPLLWLAGSLAALVFVTRWFGERIRALVLLPSGNAVAAVYVHFALLLPGTLLHELSHWLAARLLRVRTGSMSLGPQDVGGGIVRFGALEYQRPDCIRESLMGLAPLLTGSAAVILLARWRFGLGPEAIGGLQDLAYALRRMAQAQDAWVWAYLIVAVANAMLPSAADRRAWRPVAIYLGVLAALLVVSGASSRLPDVVLRGLMSLVLHLAFAFSLTVVLDVIVGGVLWAAELALGLALNRRIVYS